MLINYLRFVFNLNVHNKHLSLVILNLNKLSPFTSQNEIAASFVL